MGTDRMATSSSVIKFIRDPIHDIIRIQHPFILRLLDSAPIQRLRRIRQLGIGWLVFPGAEHSRFTHALGVFHLAGRVMNQLEQEADEGGAALFAEGRREAILAAALLHDVGHGPFSHVFEHVAQGIDTTRAASHEAWSLRIIDEHQEVREALESFSTELPTLVRQILDHTYHPYYVTAIISSQLDVDRFDFLLRDSHMTGTRYGFFDLEWMLRTLAIREVRPASAAGAAAPVPSLQTIVVDGRRGLSGLEAHLLGRHYMYRNVYYHKTIRAAEQMLHKVLERAAEFIRAGNNQFGNAAFAKMAGGEVLDIPEYLSLNDFVLMSWIEDWARSANDQTLRDLSARLVERRLLKAVVAPPGTTGPVYARNSAQLRELVSAHGYDPAYYMLEDEVADIAYKGYLYNLELGKTADEEEIWFLDSEGTPRRLSSHTSILTEASNALTFEEYRWFVPAEVERAARTHLTWS